MLFSYSAPGSLMLMGEYAVLEGKNALVCAVQKRLQVNLTPRNDEEIIIESALGKLTTTLSSIELIPPFQFVLAVLMHFKHKLKTGCHIRIESEFSDQIGFASSAAVTVALYSAVLEWLGMTMSKSELTLAARALIRKVQGLGSGADIAACVHGGVLLYAQEPLVIEKLDFNFPISVIYSGSKIKTPDAIAKVKQFFSKQVHEYEIICAVIQDCVVKARKAIMENNARNLGYEMNRQQEYMELLGVSTPALAKIIHELRLHPEILGAKISGAGFGDCAIGLGSFRNETNSFLIKIDQAGVRSEKN